MSDRPFTMEPEPGNSGSEPVERLGNAGARAAHFEAFSRPSDEPPAVFTTPSREVRVVEVEDASGWFPAAARAAAGEARPTPRAAAVIAERNSLLQDPSLVIELPARHPGSAEPHRDHLGRLEPNLQDFTYAGIQQPEDFDPDGIDLSGINHVDAGEQNHGLTDLAVELVGPEQYRTGDISSDDDLLAIGHDPDSPEREPYSPDEHEQPGSKISAFLLKNANYLIYSVGGLAGLAVVFWMFSGGHHPQPQQAFAPAAGLAQPVTTNPAGVFSPGGPLAGVSSSDLTNPRQQQTAALPPALPSQSQTTFSPTVPAPPPPVDTIPAPAAATAPAVSSVPAGSASAPTLASPGVFLQGVQQGAEEQASAAAPATGSLVSTSQTPSNTGPTSPQGQAGGVVRTGAPQAAEAVAAPPVVQPGALQLPPAPSLGQAQANKLISELGQISDAVSSLNSKFSSQQSDESVTIQQMSNQLSSLQQSVLTLETKIALNGAGATHTGTATSTPQTSAPAETQPADRAGVNVAAQNNVPPSQIAQMQVISGYDLRGYSQDAVVVGTPYGTSTIRINETVPGAGRALGLYQFGPGAQGIELVTDQGVIRPSPTGGN